MDEKKPAKPQIVRILGVPRSANVAAVISALLILIGILESAYLFNLNLIEITFISAVLFVFYVILLMFLLKPRTLKVIKRMPGKKPEDRKPAIEDIKKEVVGTQKPVVININNQTETKKKTKRKSSKKKK